VKLPVALNSPPRGPPPFDRLVFKKLMLLTKIEIFVPSQWQRLRGLGVHPEDSKAGTGERLKVPRGY